MNALRQTLSGFYWRLPRPLRTRLALPLEAANRRLTRLRRLPRDLRLPAWRFRLSRDGHPPLTVVCIGQEAVASYFRRLDGNEASMENLGTVVPYRLAAGLARGGARPDLLFVQAPSPLAPLLRRQGLAILPQWMLFLLDLRRPAGDILRSAGDESLHSDWRVLRQADYAAEPSADSAQFDRFYTECYVPYLRTRYGDSALPTGIEPMRRVFDRGAFFSLRDSRDWLGGLLLEKRGRLALFAALALSEAGTARRALMSAAYAAGIDWARQQGCDRLDFGHGRPFLRDGLVRFKRKWGMRVVRSPRETGVFGFGLGRTPPSPAVLAWLADHPFVMETPHGLAGCLTTTGIADTADLRGLIGRVALAGLSRWEILAPHGAAPGAAALARDAGLRARLHAPTASAPWTFPFRLREAAE